MSLINDALKRAHQQQQNQPPRTPGAPLQPVSYEQRGPNPWIFFAVIPLVILLLGIAGWYLLSPSKTYSTRAGSVSAAKPNLDQRQTRPENLAVAPKVELRPEATTPIPVIETKPRAVVAPPTNPVTPPTLAARTKPNPPPVPAETRVPSTARETPATLPSPVPAVAPSVASADPVATPAATANTPETKAVFPDLKLQGIYFRLNNPSVLINGRTLFVGDRIDGARITKIERQSVTVEFNGQTKVIEL